MRKRTYEGPTAEQTLVTDLIELMESSTLPPWRREWTGQKGPHRNLLTLEPYSGSNPILLELGSMMRGHTIPLWIGAAQARSQGWFPRKGSKAVRIVRPQLNKREDEGAEPTLRTWVSYKVVPVFNAADLTGDGVQEAIQGALGQDTSPAAELPARLEAAEKVLEAWPVRTEFGGTVACYSPSTDRIAMPPAEAFSSREAYVATWAHEQAHSTGHKSRLDRNLSGVQGSKAYAQEELVAELAAVLVTYRLQVGCHIENHASYLSHWAKILRESPKVLFKVLSEARKAADLITEVV